MPPNIAKSYKIQSNRKKLVYQEMQHSTTAIFEEFDQHGYEIN